MSKEKNINEMSLSKFLSRFCNLTGEDLSKIHHNDVKVLFPNLERSSFEEIEKNPLLILTGSVILVNDGEKTIPYYVPITDDFDLEDPMEVQLERTEGICVDYSKHDYAHMSIYELRQLLKRKFNSFSNQKSARRELERRGVVLSKKYDRCKEKRNIRRMKDERY